MKYKTPAALDMAVKSAAKTSPFDTNKAIASFYFDRLLCRIFSESEPAFILKGGQSMLARTISARTTRDVDLLAIAKNADEALEELKRLASIDLDDFLTYVFARAEKIKVEDEYRQGYKVYFTPYLGPSTKNEVSVDLVVDEVVCENPEKMAPVARLDINGLEVFDYLLYPVVNAMADKICATMQLFEGRESSRVKDLVDLVLFLTTQSFEGKSLRKQVESEVAFRKMKPMEGYKVPRSWFTLGKPRYAKLASETGLDPEYRDIDASFVFVSGCIDAALSREVDEMTWNPEVCRWV